LAEIGLQTTREELTRSRAERDALHAQYSNLKLISPADGLVVLRDAEPGSTIMSGQRIIELIDPKNLWVNAHFDQVSSFGLKTGLAARIVLRSRVDDVLRGHVMRVEPKADTVTEEILAKVEFEQIPEPLPPVGELAEITVLLPNLPAEPVVPNASIQRINGRMGVWQIVNGKLRYTPIVLGAGDLDGYVQVKEGLKTGDRIVVYSAKALTARSRIRSVDSIDGRVR
jgi:RND family efflux transporter MFP subunit